VKIGSAEFCDVGAPGQYVRPRTWSFAHGACEEADLPEAPKSPRQDRSNSLDVKQRGSEVREIRTLRSTLRGLETWRGRIASA
jgi:hypothetical protein